MNGRIIISSQGNGWKDNIISPATICLAEDRATINYRIEGDECTLEISDGFIVQTRKGETNLKLTFRKGEQTACIIGDVALAGGYKIFTEHLKVNFGKLGCSVHLAYRSGDDGEKINLKIMAAVTGRN